MVCTVETSEDRKSYRNHCDFFWDRNKAAAEERGRNRDRDRDRDRAQHRSRSPRGNAAKGSKGGGKQKKGESGGGAIGAMVSTSSASSTFSAAVVDDRAIGVRKFQSVRVHVDELQAMEGVLGRAIDSQKRIIESLNFFSRMVQEMKRSCH